MLVLIAEEGVVRDRIAKALRALTPEFKCFDSIRQMLEADLQDGPSAIVLANSDGAPWAVRSVARVLQHGRLQSAPVILCCKMIKPWQLRSALAAGVCGVVVCDDLEQALGPCVRAVQAGQVCVPRANSVQVAPPSLSTREKQILGLVVMGYMNGQIAQRLFLAESTVKSHLSSAFGKLGVRSRNEAVDLILNADHGFGMGILAIGGERLQPTSSGTA